jgi:membrane protein DedA with SNARE-associated domain
MIDFATQLVETIGIFGAGIFIAIESIVIPLPSEFVLLLSGFNVSIGEFQFIPLLIATTTGSLIGCPCPLHNWIWYFERKSQFPNQ